MLAAGAVIVMRPVLPSVRPFKSGGICFVLALALMFAAGTLGLGPDTVRDGYWDADFLRDRGGYLGEALFYVSSNLIGSIGTHILALFLFLAGVLLLTGASVAGVLKATGGTVAESTRVLRSATATARPGGGQPRRGAAATAAGATKGGRPRVRVSRRAPTTTWSSRPRTSRRRRWTASSATPTSSATTSPRARCPTRSRGSAGARRPPSRSTRSRSPRTTT